MVDTYEWKEREQRLERKCRHGNTRSCIEVAKMYKTACDSLGKQADEPESLIKASKCALLADMLFTGQQGLEKDVNEASNYYHRGCTWRHGRSCFQYAWLLLKSMHKRAGYCMGDSHISTNYALHRSNVTRLQSSEWTPWNGMCARTLCVVPLLSWPFYEGVGIREKYTDGKNLISARMRSRLWWVSKLCTNQYISW